MKKQGKKGQDRGEKESGQWKKGWPKSQKCQGGKEARGKEPLTKHGTVGSM